MKRFLTIILVLVTVLSLVACGTDNTTKETDVSKGDELNEIEEMVVPTESGDEDPIIMTEPIETQPQSKPDFVAYKMAKIGSDSRVSESEYGFHKTKLDTYDGEGKTFYALSWVFEEEEWTENNYNYYTFKLKDATTGEIIQNDRKHILLQTYTSNIYDTEEFEGNGIPFYGHPTKQICVFILYADYEVQFEDIETWVEYNEVDYKLEFNSELSEITSAPKRARGDMFIKLKDSYYVSDGTSGGFGGGGNTEYEIFDFISVKDPLSSIKSEEPIMDVTKITFFDTETGEHLTCVPGTELYYEEKVESDSVDVCIGVTTTDEEIRENWYERYRAFYDGITLLIQ